MLINLKLCPIKAHFCVTKAVILSRNVQHLNKLLSCFVLSNCRYQSKVQERTTNSNQLFDYNVISFTFGKSTVTQHGLFSILRKGSIHIITCSSCTCASSFFRTLSFPSHFFQGFISFTSTVRLSHSKALEMGPGKISTPGCGPLDLYSTQEGHPSWFPLVPSDWGIWASPPETDQDPCPGWLPPVPLDLVSSKKDVSPGPLTPRFKHFPATRILPITFCVFSVWYPPQYLYAKPLPIGRVD